MNPPIEIRSYLPNDKAFIYSTWLKSYKHSSYFAKRIKPMVFYAGHQALIDHLLRKTVVKTLIASPKGDPDTILGYLICETGEKPIVHFTYVKDTFRKMGVCRTLFEKSEIDPNKMHFTHWTIPVDELIQKWPGMIYNPYGL